MATDFLGAGGPAVRRARLGGFPIQLAALAVALIVALLPGSASAQGAPAPQTVFVPRTGHTSDGLFLEVWRSQRALLGDPITEEFRAETGLGADPNAEQIVQYYENAALVFLPDAAPGDQVRTLPLGRDGLEAALASRPAEALLRAMRRTACGAANGAGCLGFRETGHTVHPAFRERWDAADDGRWLGMPISEAYRAADGSWLQYFEGAALRAKGDAVSPLPIGRETAERLDLDTRRIVRPTTVPLFAATLFAPRPAAEVGAAPSAPTAPEIGPMTEPKVVAEPEAMVEPAVEAMVEPAVEPIVEPAPVEVAVEAVAGPGPQQGAFQEIVISLSAQQLWAYEGSELVNSTYVSTGTAEVPETTTPIGSHTILSKVDVQDMAGTISGEDYFVPDVPYVMYFDNLGNALHGTYWHSNFGAPMSHGCVNLPMDVAAWIYSWAGVGTAVTVIG